MHTNWRILIKMSMEIEMLNFRSVINCLCNGAWNSHSTTHQNSLYPLINHLTESYEHINDLIAFYGEGILLTTVSIFGLIGNIMSIIVLTRSINGRASGGNHINIGLSVGGTSFSNLLRGLATFDALFLLVSWYFQSIYFTTGPNHLWSRIESNNYLSLWWVEYSAAKWTWPTWPNSTQIWTLGA